MERRNTLHAECEALGWWEDGNDDACDERVDEWMDADMELPGRALGDRSRGDPVMEPERRVGERRGGGVTPDRSLIAFSARRAREMRQAANSFARQAEVKWESEPENVALNSAITLLGDAAQVTRRPVTFDPGDTSRKV
jgi:hypothetical protein